MLALRIHLLTGRYVATAYNDRGRAEWPPHPARVFSAMVATHYSRASPPAAERAALEWLEAQGPPSIAASDASPRRVMQHFVPVNDTSVHSQPDGSLAALESAELALRKARAATAPGGSVQSAMGAAKDLASAEKELNKARTKLEKDTTRASTPGSRGGTELAAAELLPGHRRLQPRTFPSVTPHADDVWMCWSEAVPDDSIRDALRSLVADIISIGHSSSLVAVSLSDAPPRSNWMPAELGPLSLRVAGPGQLAALDAEYERHRGVEPRLLPALHQAYAAPTPQARVIPASVFSGDWIVLARVGGPRLPSCRAADVATAVRGALMKHGEDPPPSFISGHGPGSASLNVPHLAFVPLPFIGAPRADGAILGVALALPHGCDDEQRRQLARALFAWEHASSGGRLLLTLGKAGVLELQRQVDTPRLHTLRAATWCHSSRRWATATPIALDRNPGQLRHRDPHKAAQAAGQAASIIASAVENIGLPRPTVQVVPAPLLAGSRKAHTFPSFPSAAGKLRRVLTHAVLSFPIVVQGPILLGAGRYRGLGLCRPMAEE